MAAPFVAAAHLVGSAHAEAAEGGREAGIVGRVVEAYGGREALAAASTVVARGTIVSESRGAGTYVRYLSRPGKLRVEIVYSGDSELRVLSGSAVGGKLSDDLFAVPGGGR